MRGSRTPRTPLWLSHCHEFQTENSSVNNFCYTFFQLLFKTRKFFDYAVHPTDNATNRKQ
jgi:hypothetical protein